MAAIRETVSHGSDMTFDFSNILASKRKYRQHLATLSIEEKLSMLDVLRERTLLLQNAKTIPQATPATSSSSVH
jgi:hypothetical protein